jgi:predicted ATPase
VESASRIAQEVLDLGETWNDNLMKYLGCRCIAVIDFYLGGFAASRLYFERTLAFYRPSHRAYLTALTAEDPHCATLLHFGWTLAFLGYLDQARARLDEGLAEARQSGRADTLAFALQMNCWADYFLRSAPSLRIKHADELAVLSAKHGFSSFDRVQKAARGSCIAASGHAEQGITLIKDVLVFARAAGLETWVPVGLIMLAEAYGFAGSPHEGLTVLAEAGEHLRPAQSRFWHAMMHRLRGELLRMAEDNANAEDGFQRSLAVARRQDARLLELRASVSLARLWRDLGKRREARDLLAPIYGWFTEGFDTPDLKEAKALLEELG